jgi:hypothetical protein
MSLEDFLFKVTSELPFMKIEGEREALLSRSLLMYTVQLMLVSLLDSVAYDKQG